MSNENGAAQAAKVQLTVSGIQGDLKNGLTRAQIQAKYGLSNKDLKGVFTHPKLKGLKTKPAPAFVLTDDTVDSAEEDVANDTTDEENIPDSTETPVVSDEF